MWGSRARVTQVGKESIDRLVYRSLVRPNIVAQEDVRPICDGHGAARRMFLCPGHLSEPGVDGGDRGGSVRFPSAVVVVERQYGGADRAVDLRTGDVTSQPFELWQGGIALSEQPALFVARLTASRVASGVPQWATETLHER